MRIGHCDGCGKDDVELVGERNQCAGCKAFTDKLASVSFHHVPWGLREARKGGFAKY